MAFRMALRNAAQLVKINKFHTYEGPQKSLIQDTISILRTVDEVCSESETEKAMGVISKLTCDMARECSINVDRVRALDQASESRKDFQEQWLERSNKILNTLEEIKAQLHGEVSKDDLSNCVKGVISNYLKPEDLAEIKSNVDFMVSQVVEKNLLKKKHTPEVKAQVGAKIVRIEEETPKESYIFEEEYYQNYD